MKQSYESILARVDALVPSASANQRKIEWLDSAACVGVSRTHDAHVEIFLTGPKISASSRVVRESLEYQTWYREPGDQPFEANRLLLPAAGYFDQVAAFLCTELLRNDAHKHLDAGFRKTEPVIELAISRLRLSDQALVGLIGELLVLEALVRRAEPEEVRQAVDAWQGYRTSARDFALGTVGIEVKTTTGLTSSHRVQGVHQVEPQDYGDDGGVSESDLLLISVGLMWLSPDQAGDDNVHTLPALVDRIIDRIYEALGEEVGETTVDELLLHIKDYGSDAEVGYDHRSMAESAAFRRPFLMTFARCYDMSDPDIQVLRADDVRQRPYTDLASVRFRINLPERVQGDINPVVGLNNTAVTAMQRALH